MEWNDLEQDTPSIRALLYDRGGLLFEEHASFGGYDEPEEGEAGKPVSERQRRAEAYYARYVKQGPYVEWADDFGRTCEQPDFDRARELKRAQQVRAVKHFIRKHLIAEIIVLALVAAGFGWVIVRRRRKPRV